MNGAIPAWKTKTRDIILESCRKWRPNLVWDCSRVQRLGYYVTLTVFDGDVRAEMPISLRIVWKAGAQRDFAYLKTLTCRLLDTYQAKRDAIGDHAAAAAQAWKEIA